MWYLVLWITGAYAPSLAIVPEKYPTEEACHAAAKFDRWSHSCIPAPVPRQLTKEEALELVQPLYKTPGYYCGQYPDKCVITNPELRK